MSSVTTESGRLTVGAPREVAAWYTSLLETGLVPDAITRLAIRRVSASRLREEARGGVEAQQRRLMDHVAALRRSPLAIETDAANRQHYELPPAFFEQVLGPRLKYSSAWWPDGVSSLAEAEHAMLDLTATRARLRDGQQVLELGCGWGSLTLYVAERFPGSRVTGVSNSHAQRRFIMERAAARGLDNVRIVTADINTFATDERFDRVVSVEMFEHARNYEELLRRVASWLRREGLLFVHIFTHGRFAYPYEVRDASDWMAQYFFTGGQMPSHDLLLHFQEDVALLDQWRMDGTHYEKTSNAWLANMDDRRAALMPVLAATYGAADARRWWTRWRVFFLACAEMFGYARGQEWGISHYLCHKK